jgi:tetratricopeptide (TPR) repeat protein
MQAEKTAVLQKDATDYIVLAEKLIREYDPNEAMSEHKLDEAMKWIAEALDRNPNDSRAILTKARILKRQAMRRGAPGGKRHELLNEALACVDRAIELTPPEKQAELLYNRACYQQLLGSDKKQVLTNLQSAFHLKPELREGAPRDRDLEGLWKDPDFLRLTGQNPRHEEGG